MKKREEGTIETKIYGKDTHSDINFGFRKIKENFNEHRQEINPQ